MKKSFMSRVLAVTLSAAMAFSLSSANMVTAEAASTPKLTTSPATTSAKKLVVLQGAKAKLTVKSVKGWKVTAKSNSTAATVKVTKASTAKPVLTITGKTAGKNVTVTLTAKKGKKKATKKVYVYVGKKSASVAAATVKAGESTTLALKTSAMRKTWKITKAVSSDEAVAKVTKTAAKQVTVEGVKEGSANITVTYKQRKYANKATATGSAKTAKAKVTVTAGTETPVEDSFKITSVEATKANELKVTFAEKIESTKDVKFTVTRGTDTVSINDATIMWDTDAKVATIQTASDMIDGTYTVSAEYNGKTATGTVVVGKGYTIDTNSAINIVSVKATKVKELTVTFHETLVSTSAVKFTVTKSGSKVDLAGDPVWNTSGSSIAKLTTSENMTAGTYVVTAELGTSKTEGSAEVTTQKVTEIKIINDTALTAKGPLQNSTEGENAYAYVYYDVLDQYGDSMRDTTSLMWSFSCDKVEDDKTLGRIKLRRSDRQAFTYGEKISVNATHSMTGVTAYKLLEVGQAQAVSSVEVKGFVKKNTTTILKALPKGFTADEYYMIFTGRDQNDCLMDTTTTLSSSDVTFLPGDPLLIKEVKIDEKNNVKTMTVDGQTYYAAVVEPGIDVNKGGTTKLTVIGNRTGKQTEIEVVVGEYTKLASFDILSAKNLVADGEKVEIGYSALDTEGKQITDFVTLANQSQFSDLSLNASVGQLKLEEQDDGSAKLFWYDSGYDIIDTTTSVDIATWAKNGWDASTATDNLDRQVSLTSVVVGAGSSNQMISICDKAYPVKIKDVDLDNVIIAGDTKELRFSAFTFEDQYGRDMKKLYDEKRLNKDNLKYTSLIKQDGVKLTYVYDNGFFYNAQQHTILQNDFNGFEYGIKASAELISNDDATNYYVAGSSEADIVSKSATVAAAVTQGYMTLANPLASTYADKTTGLQESPNKLNLKTQKLDGRESGDKKTASTTQQFRFEIFRVKKDSTKSGEATAKVGTHLDKSTRIVPIALMSNFRVRTLDPVQIRVVTDTAPDSTEVLNGVNAGFNNASLSKTLGAIASNVVVVTSDQSVKVDADYSGTTVEVPGEFLAILTGSSLGYKVKTDGSNTPVVSNGGVKINFITTGVLVKDIYNDDSNLTKKMGSKTIKVRVCGVSGSGLNNVNTGDAYKVTDLQTTVKFSDEISRPSSILAIDKLVINPKQTRYLVSKGALKDASVDGEERVLVKDQYAQTMNIEKDKLELSFKLQSLKENAAGYAGNNLKVENNETLNAVLKGAELGDTLKLEMKATAKTKLGDFDFAKEIDVTVGADKNAYIVSGSDGNVYKNVLIGKITDSNSLERQRNDGLGNDSSTTNN